MCVCVGGGGGICWLVLFFICNFFSSYSFVICLFVCLFVCLFLLLFFVDLCVCLILFSLYIYIYYIYGEVICIQGFKPARALYL